MPSWSVIPSPPICQEFYQIACGTPSIRNCQRLARSGIIHAAQREEGTGVHRVCLAIDLKSFYASVECMDQGLDPLTARLVVADASRTDKTICLAVSPALKAYGIPGRCRLFEVKEKLKEVKARTGETVDFVIATPRMARYMEVSAKIYAVYLRFVAPEDIHVYSIDEVLMDVTEYLHAYGGSAHEMARRIIREVLGETGITATAGIGTNLYLAKVAMDIVSKHTEPDGDGVRIGELDETRYRELLWDHRPITAFWRIGHGTAGRLERNGMYTMGDIARRSLTDEESLYRLFGVDAELLIDHAWGLESCRMQDIKAFKPRKSSTGSGQVLPCPYDMLQTRLIVQEMTDQLVMELVEKHMLTDSVTVNLSYDRENVDRGFYTGKVHEDRYGRKVPEGMHFTAHFHTPTCTGSQIMEGVLRLYDEKADPTLTVRAVYVTAGNVVREENAAVQLDMFTDTARQEKERKLQNAMLGIREKYGKNAILRGINLSEGARERERN
ncbi:MAG: DNA methylase, partial [Clostridia bacterium]|nr:DNA methylase [Clostridia bacterium]